MLLIMRNLINLNMRCEWHWLSNTCYFLTVSKIISYWTYLSVTIMLVFVENETYLRNGRDVD